MSMVARGRERGVALVAALVLVALALGAVVPQAMDERIAIARTARLSDLSQATHLARGVEAWAEAVLLTDAVATRIDHHGEPWARPVEALPVEGGELNGQMSDEQGKFNLNGLLVFGQPDRLAVERLERLLVQLELDPQGVNAILDWLDEDDVVREPGGAESPQYLLAPTPYRPGNGPMAMSSELLMVKGFDLAGYRLLRPHVTALPVRTAVNINTASAELIGALAPDASASSITKFLSARLEKPVAHIDTLGDLEIFAGGNAEIDEITVGSDWFLMSGTIRLRRARIRHNTLLYRSANNVRVWHRWSGMP
jgi:general secretion pathway protein K